MKATWTAGSHNSSHSRQSLPEITRAQALLEPGIGPVGIRAWAKFGRGGRRQAEMRNRRAVQLSGMFGEEWWTILDLNP
jgi:hypothetical protein